MKPVPHQYDVRMAGPAAGRAVLSAEGLPDLDSSPPAEFGGPGDAWTPEHMVVAAVETCLLFTFRAVARAAKFPFVTLDVDGSGYLDRPGGITRFTEIVVRVRLQVPPGTDLERARQLLEKSERNCLVTASLSTPVRLETSIAEVAEPLHAA